ncbi:MAG: hypothetical protein RJB01_1730 [Actinomycetota bacterium]|jgi:CBS domain-containing protein
MKVSSIVAAKGTFVATITPTTRVTDAIEMLTTNRVGCLVVSENGSQISGMFSERDVIHALGNGPGVLGKPVSDFMTRDVRVVDSELHLDELMKMMTEFRIRHLPVVDESGSLTAIVSIGDVVKHRLDELESERAALLDYVTRGG